MSCARTLPCPPPRRAHGSADPTPRRDTRGSPAPTAPTDTAACRRGREPPRSCRPFFHPSLEPAQRNREHRTVHRAGNAAGHAVPGPVGQLLLPAEPRPTVTERVDREHAASTHDPSVMPHLAAPGRLPQLDAHPVDGNPR